LPKRDFNKIWLNHRICIQLKENIPISLYRNTRSRRHKNQGVAKEKLLRKPQKNLLITEKSSRRRRIRKKRRKRRKKLRRRQRKRRRRKM